MKEKSKEEGPRKRQFNPDKYYNEKADFEYLKNYGYEVTQELGRGGYGVVYKARQTGGERKDVAIKINFNTVARELVFAEIAYLQLVKGKENFPKLVDLFNDKDITHIVIEYFEYEAFITYFNEMTLEDVKHYLHQLLSGLLELKRLGIYHRDIKPGNFLYNRKQRRGIIIDFGLAEIDTAFLARLEEQVKQGREAREDVSRLEERLVLYRRLDEGLKQVGRNKIGTETYMPLESILHHSEQSYEADIWPVGVIFLQFVTRKYSIFNNLKLPNKPSHIKNSYYINYIMELAVLFGRAVVDQCREFGYDLTLPKELDVVVKFDFKKISFLTGFDQEAEDLLKGMLCIDPHKRVKVEEALAHPFFRTVLPKPDSP